MTRKRMPLAAIVAISVAILAACSGDAQTAAAPAPVAVAPAHRTGHLTVTVVGRGPDVILIPGLASPRELWDGVVPALSRTHRIHLVEVRGFASDDAGENAGPGVLDGLVSDLASYIDSTKLKTPAVVGHSMGGLVAIRLAAEHPDRVGRLMVVDTLPFFGTLLMPGATAESIEPRAAAMRDTTLARAGTADAAVTADPGGIMSMTPAGRIKVAQWAAKANPRVVAQALYEDIIADLRPVVPTIRTRPFTVLYAAGAPGAEAVWSAAYAGTPAKLVPIPDSYHFIMLDQPERFGRELNAFLTD